MDECDRIPSTPQIKTKHSPKADKKLTRGNLGDAIAMGECDRPTTPLCRHYYKPQLELQLNEQLDRLKALHDHR